MSEPKETTDKTAAPGARKPLSLVSRVESGHVQQKFSHGRSKTVVVEKKRSRNLKDGDEPAPRPPVVTAPSRAPSGRSTPPAATTPATPAAARPGALLRTLSEEERVARSKALAAAQERSVQEARERAERARLEAIETAAREERNAAALAEATAKGEPAP